MIPGDSAHLCLFCLSWKGADHVHISLDMAKAWRNTTLPFFGPQEGNIELQLKLTGFAKAGVQFTNLRINELKRIS